MAKTQNKAAGAKTAGKNKKFKKRERKNVPFGLVFIQASFNNTIVTITDQQGNTLSLEVLRFARLPRLPQGNPVCGTAGCGRCRQRCSRPRPPLGRCARLRSRLGRESAIRALATAGIEVRSIRDVTPMPHNGCRPPKRRRV